MFFFLPHLIKSLFLSWSSFPFRHSLPPLHLSTLYFFLLCLLLTLYMLYSECAALRELLALALACDTLLHCYALREALNPKRPLSWFSLSSGAGDEGWWHCSSSEAVRRGGGFDQSLLCLSLLLVGCGPCCFQPGSQPLPSWLPRLAPDKPQRPHDPSPSLSRSLFLRRGRQAL